jgi:FlaA1/EpsC-like NDP-sugar epimerase
LYKQAWEYASIGELLIICKSVTFSILTTAAVQLITMQNTYFRLLAVTWMLHMLLIGGSRFFWRIFRDPYMKQSGNMKRTLIIGAGSAGTMVARQLISGIDKQLLPVAFIDDNIRKQNVRNSGYRRNRKNRASRE